MHGSRSTASLGSRSRSCALRPPRVVRYNRGMPRLVLIVLALAALCAPAAAHQTSVKYVDVAIDGARAAVTITVAPGDVTEPLGLPADARPPVADARTPAVAHYVQRWLAIATRAPCPAQPPRASPDADARFVVVAWEVTCADELVHVTLDFRAFFAVDPRHEAIVTVHPAGEPGDAIVVRAGEPVLQVSPGEPVGLLGWVGAGIDHIWSGRDHVCFVLVLLLVAMLAREGGRWVTRPPLATLRATATVITAFTLPHSLSLIAAALGWVQLPSRLVESLIAFSILYTALEDIARPDTRWRFLLTFGFGLVHGLGFASVLAVMLPPDHIIAPLLGFNLGVELGQLVIVVIALPLAWLACRELGAERYRRRVLPAIAALIAVIALKWLIERVFAITLPTLLGM